MGSADFLLSQEDSRNYFQFPLIICLDFSGLENGEAQQNMIVTNTKLLKWASRSGEKIMMINLIDRALSEYAGNYGTSTLVASETWRNSG